MSKIAVKKLSFNPSLTPDVAGHKLYIEEAPAQVSYQSQSFDLGDQTNNIDLGAVIGEQDGTFNIGLTAYDDAGNESDMYLMGEFPLDFTAPDAPSGGTIT